MTANGKLVSRDGLREKGITGSPTTIWRQVRDGVLPAPIRIGGKTYWLEDELNAWLAARVAARDGRGRKQRRSAAS
jgi:hypothetical protein